MRIVSSDISQFCIEGPAAREAACITLRDEEGREARGEAAPLAGFSSETLSEAQRALKSTLGTLAQVDDKRAGADAVHTCLLPFASLLDPCPSARFALETALFDLLSQRRGVDMASCLRDEPRALDWVETSALVAGPASGDDFIERALGAVARGFRVLKVKLRATGDAAFVRELAGLIALRRAAPPDIELRLDPNGRWSVPQAREYLGRLVVVEPAFVEQPVAAGELHALGPCAVRWAADESLGIAGMAERLTPALGCGAFILKPAALGIGRARGLAALARALSLPTVITHFMDGPIGLAAACEVALSLDPAHDATSRNAKALIACGLEPHPGLVGLTPSELPHHSRPGRITPRYSSTKKQMIVTAVDVTDGRAGPFGAKFAVESEGTKSHAKA